MRNRRYLQECLILTKLQEFQEFTLNQQGKVVKWLGSAVTRLYSPMDHDPHLPM